jgi:small subunit ribosomal protein S21
LKILLGPREPLEKALRRFKRVCSDAGIFSDIKRGAYFEKPSEKRRRARRKRLKNIAQASTGRGRSSTRSRGRGRSRGRR